MRRSQTQYSLLDPAIKKPSSEFGGSLLNGNHAKIKRTLDSKLPLLVTFRANGSYMRLPKAFGKIESLIAEVTSKYGIRLYEHANVGNHIHLLVRCPRRKNWNAYSRELWGRIALMMKKLKLDEVAIATSDKTLDNVEPSETIATSRMKPAKFWMHRPHTRVIASWKKAFQAAKKYVIFNQWEGDGHISRKDFAKPKDFAMFWATVPRLE